MVRTESSIRTAVRNVIEFAEKKGISVDLAAVFGSYVSGTPTDASDVDIALFSKDIDGKSIEERAEIASSISLNCGDDIELHLYTMDAAEHARPTNFAGYILETGRIVYKNGSYAP